VEEVEAMIETAKNRKPEDLEFKYKGILYPSLLCQPENVDAMESFEAREDDILLAAYPKCGYNWVIEVLNKMAFSAGKLKNPKYIPYLEFTNPEKMKKLSTLPSTRILGTHMSPNNIPVSFFEKKSKILVVLRNPKDTAVSYFHFYNKNPVLPTFESWDKFFSLYISGDVMWGSYFDYAVLWEKHIDSENVKFVTFEDLKANLPEGIEKIAKYLNYTLSDEQIRTIAEECTFDAMKEKSKETHGSFGKVIFRKGGVGDWKNHLIEEQSKEMDAKFEQCLAGTKIGAMIKYEVHCK
ncbi:ST6B1 Sulfotransferase, partial [Polyodon spathula]|nr:ST6B1 Sulfotransferase [Polyodon spathula]